jgi:ubiquinone/menaquinone biosynthesis C-methylase UbiE
MNIDELQKNIIAEFGTENAQKAYKEHAEEGLWYGESELINKYFVPGSRILDLGCGTGRTTLVLNDLGYKATGLDITPKMIDSAIDIASTKGKNISYVVGDATSLTYNNSSFDGVLFSCSGWTQIPTKEKRMKALREVLRILKPGGYFIFTAHPRIWPSRHFFFSWIWLWIRFYFLKRLGFKITEKDFGDRMFKKESRGLVYKTKQYIHVPTVAEVTRAVTESGFKMIWSGRFKKRPVYYVCQKP